MKKEFAIIGILSLFMIVSCKKDHVCSCKTITISDGQETEEPEQNSVLVKMTKNDAIDTCNEKDTYTNDGGSKTTKNCEIN
jgi:hypothetical protein